MSLLDHQLEPKEPRSSVAVRFTLVGLFLIGCGVVTYFLMSPAGGRAPAGITTAPPPRTTARGPEPDPEPVPEPTTLEIEPDLGTEPNPAPEPAPAAAAAVEPTVPESRLDPLLRVAADVTGASVFIDRQFVGTTPFVTNDVRLGTHRLNVSAEGYEGFAQNIDVGDDSIVIDVRFLEIRLNASVLVTHKHRFGSCVGTLRADTNGIHYETNDDDAFSLPFSQIERHEIDYLEHTLTVKQLEGRTYNFTDEQDTAEALFTFHRSVEQARERLKDQ